MLPDSMTTPCAATSKSSVTPISRIRFDQRAEVYRGRNDDGVGGVHIRRYVRGSAFREDTAGDVEFAGDPRWKAARKLGCRCQELPRNGSSRLKC